jgi:hypothetical protein
LNPWRNGQKNCLSDRSSFEKFYRGRVEHLAVKGNVVQNRISWRALLPPSLRSFGGQAVSAALQKASNLKQVDSSIFRLSCI